MPNRRGAVIRPNGKACQSYIQVVCQQCASMCTISQKFQVISLIDLDFESGLNSCFQSYFIRGESELGLTPVEASIHHR